MLNTSKLPQLNLQACTAPFWANTGHGQTLWAHFLKSPMLQSLGQGFEVVLGDGDRLSCFYIQGTSSFVISLFHGLSGDVYADYMQRTALLCQKLGHTVVLVNHRGAGHGVASARHPYHSGRSEDISSVLGHLRVLFPQKKHISIGYSMSGNMLLCLLGGFRGHERPDGAITVNAPINLARGSELLKQGLNRLYDLRFVARLKKNVEEKYKRGLIAQPYHIPVGATVWDFDQIYTAPAGGFRSREDYYQNCSALNYLSNIQTPTYILTAQDDPFVSVQDYLEVSLTSATSLHIEKRGGHLGYLTAKPTILGTHRWLDYYILTALQGLEQTLL